MNNSGERVPLFGAAALREIVLGAFPELASEIDPDAGVHMIMGRLEKVIMAAVRDADYPRARAVLTVLDGLLNRHDLDPEIPNAVSITFLDPESLCTSELGRRLWAASPPRIRTLVLANQNRREVSAE